jgi:two-component system invasion response regulator UvrY
MTDTAVLIVDDQEPFRSVARTVVSMAPGFSVVAEVDSGEAAIDAAAELRPGLILMDINLPGITGIEATRRIVEAGDSTVVLMSTYTERDLPADARTCGAVAYVHKEDLGPDILTEYAPSG